MVPNYYLQEHVKSNVYEMKSQMVVEPTGHIFHTPVEIRNDSAMLYRARHNWPKRMWWPC